MAPSPAPEVLWAQISEFVAERLGLHYPPERRADLQRGLAGAAGNLGFANVVECAQWLLSASVNKTQLQALACHLTVGETYFFREQRTFDVLGESVLPALLCARRNGERRLRIWSAACCTGEEPYSLAILLDRVIPDLAQWQVTILATDINNQFLQKATAGVYGEWSFRDSPAWLKERYFTPTKDGRYAIVPEIKKRVTFAHLNLVEDAYPSLATDTNAMDIILCRNVLMYFVLPQVRKVVENLHRTLVPDGWLVVSPSEGSQVLLSQFAPVNFSGVILYQHGGAQRNEPPAWTPPLRIEPDELGPSPWAAPASRDLPAKVSSIEESALAQEASAPLSVATFLYQEGHYAEAADMLLASFVGSPTSDPASFSLLARALANQGELSGALTWCDRWVATDKLDPSGYYLRAVVLQELGDLESAQRSLQRALYLQPDFVLAHFALGNLARCRSRVDESERHLMTALRLLRDCQPNELLPESDGLTAGRLSEIISSLVAREAAL